MATLEKGAQKSAQPKIKVTENGPFLVSGGIPLTEQLMCIDAEGQYHGWKEGERFPAQENYALCRCGQSKTQPYCDGTHTRVKFDGTETARRESYLEQAVEIAGPGLKLTDAEDFCVGAGFCHRAGGTWNLVKASSKPEARKIAIEEAGDCPSGRLVTWDKNGKAIEPSFKPSIGLITDSQTGKPGPLWVLGGVPVESADGFTYEIRNRVTLCRCGKV